MHINPEKQCKIWYTYSLPVTNSTSVLTTVLNMGVIIKSCKGSRSQILTKDDRLILINAQIMAVLF